MSIFTGESNYIISFMLNGVDVNGKNLEHRCMRPTEFVNVSSNERF